PELPPPPSQEQLLLDRQLMEMYNVISQKRVEREDNDPRWESGRVKPDDGMRDLGELFEEAPSEDSYPEYHAKVKNIMDLNTIKTKVLDREYSSVEGLLSDVALMYSNAQVIRHEQATKDGKQLLDLAQTTVERLRRERKEGTPRKDRLREQQSASGSEQRQRQQQQQQQQPAAAVFGTGLRINCAKCTKLRRDPPPAATGGRPSKACTKKERYWFCESCVTESPDEFTGRGIGVCRRDGKWKMATVRGYEPLSGKHEVLYRGDIPWEFLSLGDPCNHIRYCQPVPPASLNSVQEMQQQQQRRRRQQQQLQQEEGGDAANEVVNVMDVDPPSPLSAHPHLPGGVNERDRDGSPPPEKGVPLEAAGGGGAGGDESVPSPRGGDAATAAVAVRKEKARDGGAGGTSESVSVGDRHRVIDGERHAGRSDEAAAAAAVAAAGPSAEASGTARGEAAVLAHEEQPAKVTAKRKREEDQDADEDGAEAGAKRKREEDGTGGAGGSVASVGLSLIPAPPAAGAAETPEGASTASMGAGGSSERDRANAVPMVNDVVRSAEAPAQRSRPTAAAAAAAVGGVPADAWQELRSGKDGGINAAPKAVEIPAVGGAAIESTKRPQSTVIDGNAKLPDNCTAAASGPGVSGEGGEGASTWVEVDGSGGGGGSSSSQAGLMPAAGPNGLPPQGTATSSIPADGTVTSAGAGGSGQRPRSMMATPPLPPSLDGARADWRAKGMAGTTREEDKGERPEGMEPHVLEGGRESSRDQPLPHQPSATDSAAQRGGG
ncbi:unnamed protein product, partial [Ectocarpus sp. 12 AP-2014]